jgi:predicted HicB family RNase H-like nuclease
MSKPVKTVEFKVRMTPALKSKVRALAGKLNLSMNQVVSEAVVLYLAERRTAKGKE